MKLGEAVSSDSRKVAEAKDLERRLSAKIQPLLTEWTRPDRSEPTLIIEPRVASLHIVSGGARFWIGGMAGNSTVDMDLALIDSATQEVIAKPRIQRSADAMTGGWSVGASDQNLLDYIASIAYEYLATNH